MFSTQKKSLRQCFGEIFNFDKLATPKGRGFCYHQSMLKKFSFTRSTAMVVVPCDVPCLYRVPLHIAEKFLIFKSFTSEFL